MEEKNGPPLRHGGKGYANLPVEWLVGLAKLPQRSLFYIVPCICFILSLLLSSFSPSFLHPFHTSLTQMQYDAKSQAFEVSVRVFTDDFETALTKENGGKLVRLNNGQKQDKLVEQYVRKHFALAGTDRKPSSITYVGYEQEADAQWVYLEIPYVYKNQNVFIKQDLFIDLFADQVNLVTIQLNQVKKTVVFRNNQPVQAVTL